MSFIHEISGHLVADVREQILSGALLPKVVPTETDLQASNFDHARDLREHEVEHDRGDRCLKRPLQMTAARMAGSDQKQRGSRGLARGEIGMRLRGIL